MIDRRNPRSHPLVTVIIPTLNSAVGLSVCIQSIQEQSYSPLEIIIVDGFSHDSTVSIARAHEVRVEQLHGNRMVARALGVSLAAGEYVLFVDSDQVLEPQCVANLVEESTTKHYDALTLLETSIGDSRWARLLAAEDSIEFELNAGLPRWFRAEVIRDAIAVPSEMMIEFGEDRVILERILSAGHSIGLCRAAKIAHKDPDLLPFFQKQYKMGSTTTGGAWTRVYAKYAFRSTIRKLDWLGLMSSDTSRFEMMPYWMLQFYRLAFRSLGFFAARVGLT